MTECPKCKYEHKPIEDSIKNWSQNVPKRDKPFENIEFEIDKS